MKLDMHFHSTLSDGRKTSKEILGIAKEKWLYLAICTDHDIINTELPELLLANWIQSSEWVEISIFDSRFDAHLHFTAYAKKFNQKVVDILSNTRNWRKEKIDKQIGLLQKNWFVIDINEFYEFYKDKSNIDNLNISHIAWYVWRNPENVITAKKLAWEDIDREWFLKRCLKKEWDMSHIWSVTIPEYEPRLEYMWELLKEDNAVLSLAHPNFKLTQAEFKSRIWYYVDLWVNAIEINSKASSDWVELILRYQKKYDYILTFWSDCHFNQYSEDKHSELWAQNPYINELDLNINLLRFRKKLGLVKPFTPTWEFGHDF